MRFVQVCLLRTLSRVREPLRRTSLTVHGLACPESEAWALLTVSSLSTHILRVLLAHNQLPGYPVAKAGRHHCRLRCQVPCGLGVNSTLFALICLANADAGQLRAVVVNSFIVACVMPSGSMNEAIT